jgi:hypothetical protein
MTNDAAVLIDNREGHLTCQTRRMNDEKCAKSPKVVSSFTPVWAMIKVMRSLVEAVRSHSEARTSRFLADGQFVDIQVWKFNTILDFS